ncbi:MAG: peptide ABC transporter substrate-binding protein [Erysipelotrichaceae bacterium]|nr:peptide ABC transporter substrate-binding protein [Erysipelotrichaceae bacterium]
MKKLLVALLALLLLVGCSGGNKPAPEGGDQPAGDGTVDYFSMITSFDVTTLDYVFNNKSSNGDYLSNFIEGLLTQDPHGKLVAGMATEWSANDDASEWTFTIRDDAVWSTNTGEVYAPVTAQDFVTGLKHAADSKSETLSLVLDLIVGLRDYVEGTGSWDNVGIKVDGNKVTYSLTQGCGYFDGMTTYSILWPINQEFFDSLGGEGGEFGTVDPSKILYNGIYLLSNLTAKSVIEMVTNPNYYDLENVHVNKVTVTYTDGSDPTQAWKMYVNGETTSAGVQKAVPEIYDEAMEKFPDNIYKSDTTSTSFWGAFNFDRQLYNLYNDPSVSTSEKTDKQKADAKAAILNKNFRLAIFSAYSMEAYYSVALGDIAIDRARNTLVPYTFSTFSDGTPYGDVMTNYLREMDPLFADINLVDGQDGWYNPDRAKAFMERAVAELPDVTWPVILDYPTDSSDTQGTEMDMAMKACIEEVLGDYVQINLVLFDSYDAMSASFYSIGKGEENSIDLAFSAGWGPDYGDPLTYLHCFHANDGDMMAYSGLNVALAGELESQKAAKETIGLYEITELIDAGDKAVGDERLDYFAKAEAMLLANGILRPFATRGAGLVVSNVKPYSAAYGMYGQASYNVVPYFKYMVVYDHPVTAAEHDEAKAAWLKGE